MYTDLNYQDDKQFEVYLITEHEIKGLSMDLQKRLSAVLDYCYLQKRDLQKVLCITRNALEAQKISTQVQN